jgi:hypothetical protein
MRKLVFNGCSGVTGFALDPARPNEDAPDAPGLFVNLCHKNIAQFQNLELVNLAESGASNSDIFMSSVGAISRNLSAGQEHKIHTMLVGWTDYPRLNISVGFELYPTFFSISGRQINSEIKTNQLVVPKNILQDLHTKLHLLHHDHEQILNIVKYTNILHSLATHQNINIYFINLSLLFDQDYFVKLNGAGVLPNDYTPYTKKQILNIDNRSDEEIFKLYDKMHQDYAEAGGVHPEHWVNLYNSFTSLKIDQAFDNRHCGLKSHQLFFQLIQNFLNQQTLC